MTLKSCLDAWTGMMAGSQRTRLMETCKPETIKRLPTDSNEFSICTCSTIILPSRHFNYEGTGLQIRMLASEAKLHTELKKFSHP